MSRQALKFTDLNAFLDVMHRLGYNGEVTELLYEESNLPFCSAYLLPIDLLPSAFDFDLIQEFGGVITQVQPINFIGTERFYSDFMVYPLSRTGYVEVEGNAVPTFAPSDLVKEEELQMIYVINLEDGGGQEFFLTVGGGLVSLTSNGSEVPQEFKTSKLADKKKDQIRDKYPATCSIYVLEKSEFEIRRRELLPPPQEPE